MQSWLITREAGYLAKKIPGGSKECGGLAQIIRSRPLYPYHPLVIYLHHSPLRFLHYHHHHFAIVPVIPIQFWFLFCGSCTLQTDNQEVETRRCQIYHILETFLSSPILITAKVRSPTAC